MKTLLDNPAFGIALTLLLYSFGGFVSSRVRKIRLLSFLNPFVIAVVTGMLLITLTGIPLASFNVGGQFLNFFLGPLVVVLAVPIYRSRQLIRLHALPILGAVITASFVSITSVVWFSRLLGLEDRIIRSMMGKSTTTPIAMELAVMTGGDESLAILGVTLTGILGSLMAKQLFRLLRIRHPLAQGLALGSTSHAIGTAEAFSIGPTEGAMSGLAMGISGIVSVLWLPVLMAFYRI